MVEVEADEKVVPVPFLGGTEQTPSLDSPRGAVCPKIPAKDDG